MNTIDLQNYIPSALVVIGAMGVSAAIQKYWDRFLELLSNITQEENPMHRIEIKYDESQIFHSPMTL